MNRNLLLAALISSLFLCFIKVSNANNTAPIFKQTTIKALLITNNDSITFKTFKTDTGWGYDIYMNGKLYVHQPTIPAIAGNNGFTKEEYATKTAKLVIEKIRNNILPPTVSVEELDSLKVL